MFYECSKLIFNVNWYKFKSGYLDLKQNKIKKALIIIIFKRTKRKIKICLNYQPTVKFTKWKTFNYIIKKILKNHGEKWPSWGTPDMTKIVDE